MSNNDYKLRNNEYYSSMIEHSHLKIMQALHVHGTLTQAANALCLTQSALSHQIRYLEKKLEVSLWEKEGRNLRLTQAGEQLLQVAQQVLPVLTQAERTLKAYGEGRQGVLRIGVECYPCYEWLTGVIGEFIRQMPDVDIDLVNKFKFSGLEGLLNHHIDILLTPDQINNSKIHYQPLAAYELVLLVANDHSLANKKYITAEDLANEVLLTFPVPADRLDVLTSFLNPAHIRPHKQKSIESLEIMLELTSLNRGVCVVPEWLVDKKCQNLEVKKLGLGKKGIHKKLYLAMREKDQDVAYLKEFISIGERAATRSFQ